MSGWVAGSVLAGSAISAYSSNKAGKKAAAASKDAAGTVADSSLEAAKIQAKSEQDKLDYLKSVNALPQELRDKALKELGDYYKTPTNEPRQAKDQQTLITEAMNSPLYKSIMGTKDDALDSIARYGSATGGLRSGNSQVAFGRESQKISNQALLDSYNQAYDNDRQLIADDRYETNRQLAGISGLAGLDTGSADIANSIANVGSINANGVANAGNAKAGGILASGQAEQQSSQNMMNNILGIAGLGIQAYGLKQAKI